jgi:arylsulfatase A-like enzyme
VPAGARVDTPASIVDVAPTVLELAGAAPLPDAQGISLAPAFAGRDLPRTRPLFFSWLGDQATGVRHGSWKYLRSAHHHELFDLAADPLELLPRGRGRPARPVETLLLAEYRAESARLRERFNRDAGAASADVPIDERMQESLRALGYVD